MLPKPWDDATGANQMLTIHQFRDLYRRLTSLLAIRLNDRFQLGIPQLAPALPESEVTRTIAALIDCLDNPIFWPDDDGEDYLTDETLWQLETPFGLEDAKEFLLGEPSLELSNKQRAKDAFCLCHNDNLAIIDRRIKRRGKPRSQLSDAAMRRAKTEELLRQQLSDGEILAALIESGWKDVNLAVVQKDIAVIRSAAKQFGEPIPPRARGPRPNSSEK